MRDEWPILAWRTKEERRREREERDRRDTLAEETEPFNALLECGHRYASQVLPDGKDEEFLAWSLAGRNVREYHWILENLDVVQLTEAYAFKRTDLYLDSEDADS